MDLVKQIENDVVAYFVGCRSMIREYTESQIKTMSMYSTIWHEIISDTPEQFDEVINDCVTDILETMEEKNI